MKWTRIELIDLKYKNVEKNKLGGFPKRKVLSGT